NNTMLTVRQNKKPPYHQYTSVPAADLAFPKQEANATSNNPAMINITQFIFLFFCKDQQLNLNSILKMMKNSVSSSPKPAEVSSQAFKSEANQTKAFERNPRRSCVYQLIWE